MRVASGGCSDSGTPEYISPEEFVRFLKWLRNNKKYKWTTIDNVASGLIGRKRDCRTTNYSRNVWVSYCDRDTSIPIREPEDLAEKLVFLMFPWYGPSVLRAINTFYREINKKGYDNDWQKFFDESGDLLTLKQTFKSYTWTFATVLRAWYLYDREPDYDLNVYGRWYVKREDDTM
jgi:hypothetical protein